MSIGSIPPIGIPFPPGASPFHCKGIIYVQTFGFIDENLDGGKERTFAAIEEEEIREYLGRKFVVGGWYDLFPLINLQATAARLAAQPSSAFLRKMSRWQLERQLTGTYGFISKLGSPEMVIKSSSRLLNKYYDFVRGELTELGPNHFASYAYGIPEPYAMSYMVGTEVGMTMALEMVGAKNIRHRWIAPTPAPDGMAHGIPLMRTAREVSWE